MKIIIDSVEYDTTQSAECLFVSQKKMDPLVKTVWCIKGTFVKTTYNKKDGEETFQIVEKENYSTELSDFYAGQGYKKYEEFFPNLYTFKKVFEGKRYSSDTSTLLYRQYSKFRKCVSTWKKSNGNYFQAEIREEDYNFETTVEITPLSIEQVKAYLESRVDFERFEELFGPVEE